MENDHNFDDNEEIYVDIELDDKTVTCSIVTIFTAGNKDYIALLPLDEDGKNSSGDVWIYGYQEDPKHPDADPEIIYISDDEEYEMAADAFDEYLDAQEFDELLSEEDDPLSACDEEE